MLCSARSAPRREHKTQSAFRLLLRLRRRFAPRNDGIGSVAVPKSEKSQNLADKPISPKPHDPAAFPKTLRPRRTRRFASEFRALINHHRFSSARIHARFTNQSFSAADTSWKLVLQWIRFSSARIHVRFTNQCLVAVVTSWALVLQGIRVSSACICG